MGGRAVTFSRFARPWYREEEMTAPARERFRAWLAAEPEAVRLFGVLETRAWDCDPLEADKQRGCRQRRDPVIVRTLDRDDLAALKTELIRRIEAAGGRVELGATVATVAAGELRISMA